MGHVDCVKVLLDLGVKPNPEDADGGTPLSYATQSGHTGKLVHACQLSNDST